MVSGSRRRKSSAVSVTRSPRALSSSKGTGKARRLAIATCRFAGSLCSR